MSQNGRLTFRKSLNLADSSALIIGSMIGSGIFIVSADMSRTPGSPGWLLVAGLIIVVIGVPVYYIWRWFNK